MLEKLMDEFNIAELMAKVEERTPYAVVAFQECERMNILTSEIKRSLKELDLGLKDKDDRDWDFLRTSKPSSGPQKMPVKRGTERSSETTAEQSSRKELPPRQTPLRTVAPVQRRKTSMFEDAEGDDLLDVLRRGKGPKKEEELWPARSTLDDLFGRGSAAKVLEKPEPKTDISLPREKLLRAKEIKARKKILGENRQNAEMERAARLRTALIPLDEVRAEWEKSSGPFHKQRVAEHCAVFRDLFRGATFTPWVTLRVEYSQEDEHVVPVYYGNMVTPSEASSPPAVSYEADKGSLWTLLLTNPDRVTNIPGNDMQSGKEICHYLPPFPAMGTGYHRFIFLLFKQDRRIDSSEDVRPTLCHRLKLRTLSSFDLYRKHEDGMTPAGLAFQQCQWDSCVSWVSHQLLNMREPVFEFARPPVYHPPQVKFPRHQPLRYLDRYRDSKEPTYGIY
ncbi:hypothetical protein Q9233_017168 [Columba guinea]|nr:hypothetical protein Q9233_017168 [Columba guinea]